MAAQTVTKLSKDVIVYGKGALGTALKYAKVELRPPAPRDFGPAMSDGMKLAGQMKSGAWKHLSVKEAALGAAVSVEVLCWFYIGECIGRRSLIGYKHIPGAWRLH